jgi:4-hydroxy-2-oxoglutarate aldolase
MISRSAVPRGIYCPTITFFNDDEAQGLDLEKQEKHTKFLIDSGIRGIVIHGTTGESVLLSHQERNTLTRMIATIRSEMQAQQQVTLVVACSAQSTREVLSMCHGAKANGGDFVLVLPPSYWAKEVTPTVVKNFYLEVRPAHTSHPDKGVALTQTFEQIADKSPLPVIIYSFPAVTNGIDMDSDLLTTLAKHPVSLQSQSLE